MSSSWRYRPEEAAACVAIAKEEAATETDAGTSRSGAVQSSSPEQPYVESGQRSYDRAITDFVDWYCSEPRLSFNRTVVLRYRMFLEQKRYSPTTIDLRLAAVRRVAFEAADSGLLSPELAAGIRRVKGVRRIGVRLGNWLTAEQGKRLLSGVEKESLRGIRNYAILAMLIDAASDAANCFLGMSIRFNHARSGGSLPTCWARLATSEPSRSLHG